MSVPPPPLTPDGIGPTEASVTELADLTEPAEPASQTLIRRGPLRGLPVEVGVLSAVAFFVAAGFGIVAPAIPVFARSFGVSRTAAGAVISAFALMRLISALGCGRLVNQFGERLILGTGIAIVA
ncbi:MAG TPA: MFS transporter, partial [Jatrophihabitans sp.]